MKKIVSVLLVTALMCVIFAVPALAWQSDVSAISAVASVRDKINAHTETLRGKNEPLLKLTADEIHAASFSDYDTSNIVLGSRLYDFAEPDTIPSGDRFDSVSTGEENKITTLAPKGYRVHSITRCWDFPELFPNSSVLRVKDGKRASLKDERPEGVPSYQVVEGKENIYVENIDFYGFNTLDFRDCKNIIFNNCTFNDFLDNGLSFLRCRDITIINCKFINCGSRITDASNSGCAIRIVGDEDAKAQNILIENCEIEHSYGKSINMSGYVDNFIIRNSKINNSAWAAISYYGARISGDYINIIENNTCMNVGFGEPSANDAQAKTSGVGCNAIYVGSGSEMPKSIVKNNTIKNVVETGIEGPFEVVYHNSVNGTGEMSAKRYTASTEAVYITPAEKYDNKYVDNNITTKGIRCFSSYSSSDTEHKGIYIVGNSMNLKDKDLSVTYDYSRSDVEINCKKVKRIVIADNNGMKTDETSVNIFTEPGYVMDYFDLSSKCMIGSMPERARYCFNISNR